MPNFTTRVELHNADEQDYNVLHKSMEFEGFTRTIVRSTTGTVYHLPTAEYNRTSDLSVDDILASAEIAAAKTKKTYSVLVTQSAGRRWSGLENI